MPALRRHPHTLVSDLHATARRPATSLGRLAELVTCDPHAQVHTLSARALLDSALAYRRVVTAQGMGADSALVAATCQLYAQQHRGVVGVDDIAAVMGSLQVRR